MTTRKSISCLVCRGFSPKTRGCVIIPSTFTWPPGEADQRSLEAAENLFAYLHSVEGIEKLKDILFAKCSSFFSQALTLSLAPSASTMCFPGESFRVPGGRGVISL